MQVLNHREDPVISIGRARTRRASIRITTLLTLSMLLGWIASQPMPPTPTAAFGTIDRFGQNSRVEDGQGKLHYLNDANRDMPNAKTTSDLEQQASQPPDLSIAMIHNGTFTAGNTGT